MEDVVTPHITASFRQYQVEQIAADAKESACRALDIPFMEAENANIPNVTYEVSGQRFFLPHAVCHLKHGSLEFESASQRIKHCWQQGSS